MSGDTHARKKDVSNPYTLSGLRMQTAKSLVDGKLLKPLILSCCHVTAMAENYNSGIVKIKWMLMDNPHALKERQRLNGDWYCALSAMLKVQSGFQGNLKDYTDGWTCMECQCKKAITNYNS
jgi:hypothetical protein